MTAVIQFGLSQIALKDGNYPLIYLQDTSIKKGVNENGLMR